jgi:rhamnosyltransferase
MSSIAAVVVTYHPGPVVLDNVRRLSEQVDQIFVVDNGSAGASLQVVEALENTPGVQVIRNSTNLGIATALNLGIRAALQTGAEWIANFDQDSSVTDNYFNDLFRAYEMCPQAKCVGMIVPRGWSEAVTKVIRLITPTWGFVLQANTSGSLIKREVFESVGFYDDDFFIDFVDIDFCLRLKKHGFRVLKAMQVELHHELGSKQTRNLLGFKISFRDHTSWRYYYMMRNRLFVHRRYYAVSPLWVCADIGWFFYGSAQLCLEHDRRKKLKAMCAGLRDALRGRTGRHPLFPPPAK